jgi:signal transduction histidine kinase
MEFVTFPIVALGAALICLIGVTIYAISQRAGLRNRDEQLAVARAQAYAMLELSQAGVLFLDREHKLMGEASAAAPELLGHTCGAGTAFVQVIAELVDVKVRRETVAFLESMWKAEPSTTVDATQNPLARVHSGSRHLGIRFSRMVLDGRVHHIIVSIERIAAPRIVPHTIEVPALNEDTFAKRLAGETGTRPALVLDTPAAATGPETGAAEQFAVPVVNPAAPSAPAAVSVAPPVQPEPAPAPAPVAIRPMPATVHELPLAALDITDDSLPIVTMGSSPLPPVSSAPAAEKSPTNENFILSLPPIEPLPAEPPPPQATLLPMPVGSPEISPDLATTITSPETAREAVRQGPSGPDPSSIIDPPDPRLSEVLKEILHVETSRLDNFLGEARDKAGQLRAILKLPARDPQAFREKLVLILELIRGIHARAKRMPLQSVCDRAERFEEALGKLRDKQTLSGNDFLPLAVKLDDLLSHLAIQGEVLTRLREWRTQNGLSDSVSIDTTQRSATMTGTTIRQPKLRRPGDDSHPGSETQKAKRLSDLSQDSLEEMAQFLADMYSKRVSLVCVGLEDVPGHYRRAVEKILGQLIHNAIRHGLEAPADRVVQDKPEIGTVAVQFLRVGAEGYQLSVQDDGRGLDHDKIRAEAVRQGVMSADAAAKIDPRKLASLIFRPGFTTAGEGVRGIGMDVVRDLVNKAGGKVGIATKPGEYTRIRVALPHEKNASGAAVA